MSEPSQTPGGWTRIGVSSDAVMILVALALSLGFSFLLLREPVTESIQLLTGELHNSFIVALWVAVVMLAVLVPLLLLLSNRPLSADLDRRVLKVGWRTVSFGQVRYAYRRPGGNDTTQWILQLEIDGGFDARLPIVTAAQPDLTARELEVLSAMLEQLPIEPKLGEVHRAPVDDELGDRNAAEQAADQVGNAIMPYTRVSLAKPTVLLEIKGALEYAQGKERVAGPPVEGPWGIVRSLTAVLKALSGGSGGREQTTLFPTEPVETTDFRTGKRIPLRERYVNHPFLRGMVGTCFPGFVRHRNAVEKWLRAEGAATVSPSTRSRLLGWTIFLCALPAPWLFPSVITALTWPFYLWVGILLIYRARIRRYVGGRSAAIGILQAGRTIPGYVQDFYAPRFPERTYEKYGFALGIGLVTYLAIALLPFVLTGSFSLMAGWRSSEQEWERPFAVVVIVLIVVCFTFAIRRLYAAIRTLARAKAEWRLLSGGY